MRKGITSSVLILFFTMFTGSVFAGDNSDCDIYKKDKTYKGAYGLCVAYQNADAAGQADIFDNWMKKFGPDAPVLPNSPNDIPEEESFVFKCACWAEMYPDPQDVCDLGVPNGGIQYTEGLPSAGTVFIFDDFNSEIVGFNTDAATCGFKITSMFDSSTVLEKYADISDDSSDCLAEIEAIAMSSFCELETP